MQQNLALLDKDGEGTITIKELVTVMSSLGHNLTNSELQEMMKKFDLERSRKIKIKEFLSFKARKIKDKYTEE